MKKVVVVDNLWTFSHLKIWLKKKKRLFKLGRWRLDWKSDCLPCHIELLSVLGRLLIVLWLDCWYFVTRDRRLLTWYGWLVTRDGWLVTRNGWLVIREGLLVTRDDIQIIKIFWSGVRHSCSDAKQKWNTRVQSCGLHYTTRVQRWTAKGPLLAPYMYVRVEQRNRCMPLHAIANMWGSLKRNTFGPGRWIISAPETSSISPPLSQPLQHSCRQ